MEPTYSTPEADASDSATTLHARLAAAMRAAFRAGGWLEGSAQELAERFATGTQKANVIRALQLIERTQGDAFEVELQWGRRSLLAPRRRIRCVPIWVPPGDGSSADLSLLSSDLRTGEVKTTGRSDHRARARRDSASRSIRSGVNKRAAREGAASSKLDAALGEKFRFPLAPELRDELRARFGGEVLAALVAELGSHRCAGDPADVDRALRTLAERGDPRAPLRHFRFFLGRARAGELLCDAKADAERTRAAEQAARAAYAWSPSVGRGRHRPDPLQARLAGLRSRLANVGREHPARASWEAELAALAAELAARRSRAEAPAPESPADDPERLPTEADLHAAEFGQWQWGRIVDVGGGARAVVQPPRAAPPRDMLAELDRHLDTLDVAALDAADEP